MFQYLLGNMLFTGVYYANRYVCLVEIGCWDLGGTFLVTGFAVYNALTTSYMISSEAVHDHPSLASTVSSDRLSALGPLLIFTLLPSYVAANTNTTGGPSLSSKFQTFLLEYCVQCLEI